jgi:hypothetical protein
MAYGGAFVSDVFSNTPSGALLDSVPNPNDMFFGPTYASIPTYRDPMVKNLVSGSVRAPPEIPVKPWSMFMQSKSPSERSVYSRLFEAAFDRSVSDRDMVRLNCVRKTLELDGQVVNVKEASPKVQGLWSELCGIWRSRASKKRKERSVARKQKIQDLKQKLKAKKERKTAKKKSKVKKRGKSQKRRR